MVFVELALRTGHDDALPKHDFVLFVTSAGLWTERLYAVFNQRNEQCVTFEGFLHGLGDFVKAPRSAQIANVFKLCDYQGRGHISEDEFVSMMLNYPYKDLERMLPRDFVYRGRFTQDLFQSTVLSSTRIDAARDRLSSHDYNQMNLRHPSLTAMRPDSEQLEKLKALHRDNKMVQRKHMPTSVNNKIRNWAEQQFKAFAREGAMRLEEFQAWAKENPPFFAKFKEFFRASLWVEYADVTSQRSHLGFYRLNPDRQTRGSYGMLGQPGAPCRVCMYHAFVLIFAEGLTDMPARVVVFKELKADFFDRELAIDFTHQHAAYQGFRLQLNNAEDYAEWKRLTKQYSLVSFRGKYRVRSKLGAGKFSVVSLAENIETGKTFAVKTIEKARLSPEEVEILNNEVSIMRVLDSPYVIKFYEDIENVEHQYYIMEAGAGRDLMTFAGAQPGGCLSEPLTAQVMRALLEAVDYIHSAGIVHRDLKPENILVDFGEDGALKSLKIIDFGFATYIQDIRKTVCPVGTLNYMAPESFTKAYDERVDVFALGVILYFLSSGLLPFFSEEPELVIRNTQECLIYLESDENFLAKSDELKDLITKLLQRDPNDRISVADALVHPFIADSRKSKKSVR